MSKLLFISVFLIAACGLIYELVAGALASYLLGDSVTQFSTIIGSYLFAMGIGSALSRFFNRGLVFRFIWIELLVGLVGGFSSSVLFLAFAYTQGFRLILYLVVVAIGILVGLEIPLLIRILKDRFLLRDVVAHVLTVDYLGALAASLIFPILLVPKLGLVRSALLFGLVNAAVALWSTFLFADQLAVRAGLRVACALVLAALGAGMFGAKRIVSVADDNLYADEVIFAKDTRYQRIVLTEWKDDLRLFLNSHLQFSSRDEYRYHEALVHPGLASLPQARRVLVLGGGDGLAVREILKYPQIESVTLVDLDPEMTRLFSTNPMLTRLNQNSFNSPRVHITNADAFPWLDQHDDLFDFVVVDFPRPQQLLARQALHHGVLSPSGQAFDRRGSGDGAEHLALVRAGILLVSVCGDTNGTVWIGTAGGGLCRWSAGKISSYPVSGSASANFIFSIAPRADGGAWLSASEGEDFFQTAGRPHSARAVGCAWHKNHFD